VLRFGDRKGNLAFFLLRTSAHSWFAGGSRRRLAAGSGMLRIDQGRLNFVSGAPRRRASNKEQGRQCEQSQRGRVSGRCVHPPDSTRQRRGARVLASRKSNAFEAP
jgi:hypothetical protein